MDNLENLRHSLAHLLAAAVLKFHPDTKRTIGPAIENGFYYDFEFPTPIAESDLLKIEKEMKKILPTWKNFKEKKVDEKEAKEFFKDNQYKLELIDEIVSKGEKITFYTSGDFTDLCRGGHVEDARKINCDAFKLTKIAGAYWRGDENNKMLTRIYGVAFNTKEELMNYEKMMVEAEKRDHRKIGKELGIFTFDDDVGPGLPLWMPKGAVVIEELEKLAKEIEKKAGFMQVRTPHIAKESMYKKSGHLPYYKESMFPPIEYEGGKYYLKAMNCPHHHKIFAAEKHSYKDLPVRLSEYGTVYRHEKSGELFGLMRTRMLQMNDAHIYCTEEQFAEEFKKVNDMYLYYFKLFGIEKYVMRFSTHNSKKLGEKYVDEPELWKKTEDMVREVLINSKIPYVEIADEAAFYGPKIDVEVWSAIGREFTLATNQVDFAIPKRFGLTYTTKDGVEKTPLCIHRAPLGTHERFVGFLIEHFAGAFPYWLSPVQVKVLSIGENHKKYAEKIFKYLREQNVRVELDNSDETLGKKIRNAKLQKVPYILVVGDKEIESESVTIESREEGNIGTVKLGKLLEKLK
jgi:threonyl-tRNA synthetase